MQEQGNNQPQKGLVSERLLRRFKTKEERDEFTRSYLRAKRVLKEIHRYADQEVRRNNDLIDSPKGFEIENWAYLQAWYAGYRSAMKATLELTRT